VRISVADTGGGMSAETFLGERTNGLIVADEQDFHLGPARLAFGASAGARPCRYDADLRCRSGNFRV
jgi:hypothetical protein